MPTPAKPTGVKGTLTRKLGPLPAWVWGLVVVGVVILYRRHQAASSAAAAATPLPAVGADTTSTAAGDTSGGVGASVGGTGGSGSPASNLSSDLIGQLYAQGGATIDSLTNALISQEYANTTPSDSSVPPMVPAGSSTPAPGGPASQPASPATPTAQGGSIAPHATQTSAGMLQWGGLTFTSKAAFDRWAVAHGTTSRAELANHPQARQIYGTLN